MKTRTEWKSSLVILSAAVAVCLFAGLFFAACSGMRGSGTKTTLGAQSLSPSDIVLDSGGKRLYIAESDARRIDVFDTDMNALSGSFGLPLRPNGLALSHDGKTLYAACGAADGQLLAIDTRNGAVIAAAEIGHTPMSPVMSHDGSVVYLTARFDDRVYGYDAVTLQRKSSVPALREPVAIDVTPDGRYVYIANHLPSGKMIGEYVTDGGVYMIGGYQSTGYFNTNRESYVFSSVVLIYDTKFNRLVELIKLPNGSTGVRGIKVSPDGKHVYVTHVLARYHIPTTQLERGWMNTNALSIIDVGSKKLLTTVLLDDLDRGAANPWDVACTEDGAFIVVSHAGTHELSLIDRKALHERIDRVAEGLETPSAAETLDAVPNDLSFMYDIRRRIKLNGNGPRALAVGKGSVFVADYFADAVEYVDINSGSASIHVLAETPSMSEERLGEMYFNDADFCFQGWQSCASCHPDGRADGLSWDLLNDGIGNPKNTKSLLYSHVTPPVMALGVRADAETAVRAGMKYIQFTEKPESIGLAIDCYLRSMRPEDSPQVSVAGGPEAAKRGRHVFEKAGCAECHYGPYYTDQKLYDVGLGSGKDAGKAFDTPCLTELWRTSPYLFDGRADTIYDVLRTYNAFDQHGQTSGLSQGEISDLIEYLLTL